MTGSSWKLTFFLRRETAFCAVRGYANTVPSTEDSRNKRRSLRRNLTVTGYRKIVYGTNYGGLSTLKNRKYLWSRTIIEYEVFRPCALARAFSVHFV